MSDMTNDSNDRVIPEDPYDFEDWLNEQFGENYDPDGEHNTTDIDDWIYNTILIAKDFLNRTYVTNKELAERFLNDDPFSGWGDAPQALLDKLGLGPNQAGGGYQPNTGGLTRWNEEQFINRFLSGEEALIAFLGAASLDVMPDNLRPLKAVVDRFGDLKSGDGKRFVNQVKHILKSLGPRLPYVGVAISITWSAWEFYKYYQIADKITDDEFVCMAVDFIKEFGGPAWEAINALLQTQLEVIASPTNPDLIEVAPNDWEFTVPAFPVPLNTPGGKLYSD